MPITVICPNLRCRSVLQVPDNARGKKVRCGRCQKNFLVPAAPQAPTAPKSAPAKVENASKPAS